MGTSPRSPKRTPAGDSVWRSGLRCPRAGVSSPLHSGGSDIMPSGTMTGVRGARCNRSRRRRDTPAKLGVGSAKPGPELRLGMRESLGQEPLWNAERRARPAGRAPRLASAELRLRLSAFCFLFFLSFVLSFVLSFLAFVPPPDRDGSGLPLPESSDEGRECGGVLGTGLLIPRVRIKKRTARTRLLVFTRDSGGGGPREAWWRGRRR